MIASTVAMLMLVAAPPEPELAEPDKVVCKSQPVLGSRLKFTKTCKTQAEWKAHREDLAKFRRDLNKTGGLSVAN